MHCISQGSVETYSKTDGKILLLFNCKLCYRNKTQFNKIMVKTTNSVIYLPHRAREITHERLTQTVMIGRTQK